jgi:pSer/pThr/pTyr-binding forkhead associated (FHA) protein
VIMGGIGFQQWADGGSYGGLACSLLAAACLAAFALRRRRGTPRQFARAVLICLAASCLMLAPVWWDLNRLGILGPTLGQGEILFWLSWVALIGWCIPLGTLATYITTAAPQDTLAQHAHGQDSTALQEHALEDPARQIEPLGAGQTWARLIPVESTLSIQSHPLTLTRQVTIIGREADNDIMLDDVSASRHHVEIRWDHGHAQIKDLGSMNGTFVNQQVARGPVPLKSGDIIKLGVRQFRFEQVATVNKRGNTPVPIEETRKMAGTGRPANHSRPRLLPILKLHALNGHAVNGEWDIRGAVMILGRDEDCAICLPDSSVSRRHAQIMRQPDGYFVSDLQSSNGTCLNDAPLSAPALLRPGDMLQLGEIVLRCEVASSASQTTQAIQPRRERLHTEPPEVTIPYAEETGGAP